MKPSFAQSVRFWNTEVALVKSKMEIETYLEKHDADQVVAFFDKEQGKLVIRFRLAGQIYIIEKRPLPVQIEPASMPAQSWLSKPWTEKKTKLDAQALLQMGRLAKAHIELIISMVAEGHDEVLEVYRVLPGANQTFQRLGAEGMMELLHNSDMLALPAPSEFTEL